MSTARNNSNAIAYRATGLPTGTVKLTLWVRASSGVVSHSDYAQPVEIDFGGGSNYFQLYSNPGDATPELRYFNGSNSADGQVLTDAQYVGQWVKILITKVGSTWTLYWAAVGAGSWTSAYTWTSANNLTSFCIAGSYVALGSYTMPGAAYRSVRLYTGNTDAQILTDLDSATPTLGSLALAWFEGSTADLTGADSSGNALDATVVNAFLTEASDPISSGASATEATERARVIVGGFSTAYSASPASHRFLTPSAGLAAASAFGAPTDRARVQPSGFVPAQALGAASERARFASLGITTATTAAAHTDRARVRPSDFAASLAAAVSAHTEVGRVSGAGFTTAAAATPATDRVRVSDAGLVSAQAQGLATDVARVASGDFSTSGAAVMFAHTEVGRVRDGSASATMTNAATSEAVRVRDGGLAAAAATAANTERQRARDTALTVASAAGIATERARATLDGFGSLLGAVDYPDFARLVFGGYTSSGAAIVFGHTEVARVRDGGLAMAGSGAAASEFARVRPADFAASFAALSASAHTEFSRERGGGFTSGFGIAAGIATERARFGSLDTALAHGLPSEFAWVRDGDLSSLAAAIVFGHTETARVRDGNVTTVFSAPALTERARVVPSGFIPTVSNAAHSERARAQAVGLVAALSATAHSERTKVNPSGFAPALAMVTLTELARVVPGGFVTGAVILVSAHSEVARARSGAAETMLGIAAPAERERLRSTVLVSQMSGVVLATERLIAVPGGYVTVVGIQQAQIWTEVGRIRDGGMTGALSVLAAVVVPVAGGGGLGSMPFGTGPFGSGMPDGSTVRRIRAIAANAVLVPYTGGVTSSNPRNPSSPLNPRNWSVAAMDPPGSVVRLPQQVFYFTAPGSVVGLPYVTESGFVLVFDGPLAQGAQYRLAVAPPSVPVTPESGATREFPAVIIRCDAMPQDERDSDGGLRDVANPYLLGDVLQFPPALGTYQVTDSGDLANDSGEASLRKRIIRRVNATVGDFFHLLNYGSGVLGRVKKLLRPDELERIQSRVRAQVLREPEVRSCSVSVRPINGDTSVIAVTVTVTTVGDPNPVTVVVPVAL